MAKGLAPIFFTTCGVVVAGVVGYTIIEPNFKTEPASVIIAEKTPEVESNLEAKTEPETQETAKLETSDEVSKIAPVTEEQVEPIEVASVLPTFELVRVEKDGSTVIAGQGPSNHSIELVDGDVTLAETTIGPTGEFVFVLDKPLKPGAHELFLRAIPKEGEAVQSSSFAFVDVPKPNTIGDVTVLLAESGKPSKVLQKAEVEPATPETVEVAKVEPVQEETAQEELTEEVPGAEATEPEEEPASTIVSETAQETVAIAKPEENSEAEVQVEEPVVAKPVVEAKLDPVLIEAADVEAGKIFIAGTGEPRSSINIYLENKFLGSVKVADNGAFLFEGEKDIGPGRYDIRADMTKGGAEVLARAEVKLVHEPKVVEVAKEEPVKAETVPEVPETVTAEPEPVQAEAEPEVVVKAEEQVESAVTEEAEIKTEAETKVEEVVASIVEEKEPEAVAEVAQTEEPKPVEVEAPKKEIQTGSAVIIRRGDNLWTVARRNYGAGIRYTTIFDANRDQVRDPDLIYPGQVLKVPENEQSVQ